jgi:hypothetical protein
MAGAGFLSDEASKPPRHAVNASMQLVRRVLRMVLLTVAPAGVQCR